MASAKFLRLERRFWLWLLALFLFIIFIHHTISSHHRPSHIGQPVFITKASCANVPVYLSALGTVTPDTTVTVRTQINGKLLKVYFREGGTVKAGQLLAQIDPRPYEAQVLEFEGQLARDQALLANAHLDLKRYQTLIKLNSVSQQTLATQKSLVKQLEGTIKLDQGQLENAKANLDYCKITSPVSGRIGLQQVDEGNFVQTSDTNGIAVINTLDPIEVIFSLPEDDVPLVAKQIYAHVPLPVEAYDRTQTTLISKGLVDSLDNQIDPTTGTVKIKAIFNNKDNSLFPDQFVNIKLLVRTEKNATTVPTASIQQGVNGPFVYRVNHNQTVSAIPVIVGATEGDMSVIQHGISVGESIVLEGADKLNDGAKVAVTSPSREHQKE